MAAARPFAHVEDAVLKMHAARVAHELEHAAGEQQELLLRDIAALRDEMIERLR